jgi:hypothetical protein
VEELESWRKARQPVASTPAIKPGPKPLDVSADRDTRFWTKIVADGLPYDTRSNAMSTVSAHAICGDFDAAHPGWACGVQPVDFAGPAV